MAQKFDGSKHRQYPGRPPVSSELEALVVRMARENSGWGYDRIVGALANLGHQLSDQTVKIYCGGTALFQPPNEVKSHPGRTFSQFI